MEYDRISLPITSVILFNYIPIIRIHSWTVYYNNFFAKRILYIIHFLRFVFRTIINILFHAKIMSLKSSEHESNSLNFESIKIAYVIQLIRYAIFFPVIP